MSRLRVRVELNRGGAGVPLEKLASVAGHSHRFFRMLAEDLGVPPNGEWLASEFSEKALHFTAEYLGPVDTRQVHEFCAAFDGATEMRRETIVAFTRIAEAIGEDEVVGFGLYPKDEERDPAEWRSLTKRDARHIAEAIRSLEGHGANGVESRLPPPVDPGAQALFRERRPTETRPTETRMMGEFVHALETRVLQRVGKLETEVGAHGTAIRTLLEKSTSTEANVGRILNSVEDFLNRADRPSVQVAGGEAPARVSEARTIPPQVHGGAEPEPAPTPLDRVGQWIARLWYVPIAALAVFAIVLLTVSPLGIDSLLTVRKPAELAPAVSAATVNPIAAPTPPAKPEIKTVAPAPVPEPVRLDLEAAGVAWVEVDRDGARDVAKALAAGDRRSFTARREIRVLVGDAAAVRFRWNDRLIGPLGRPGQVRIVRFSADKYELVGVTAPAAR